MRPRRRCGSCPMSCARRRRWSLAGEGWHPGRDRDRRLAAGRAASPARGRDLARRRGGGARLGAQHPRLRPAWRRSRPARSTWAASAGTGPLPGWSWRRRASTPSARRSRPTPTQVLGPEDLRRTERIDAMVGGAELGLDLAEELRAAGAVRDGQSRGAAAGPLRAGARRADDGGRQARPLQPAQRRAPGARRRLRPLELGVGEDDRSTPRCGSRSTTGTARSSRGSCCASSTRASAGGGRRSRPSAVVAALRGRAGARSRRLAA